MRYQNILDDPGMIAEPPISAKLVLNALQMFPNACTVALDLLNVVDLEDPARGLVQESLAYSVLQGSAEHADWRYVNRETGAAMPSGEVSVTRVGNVIHILLDRPVARNAIDRGMRDQLFEAFTVASLDPEVSSVCLSGKGKAFCVGADLAEFGTTLDPATAHMIRMQRSRRKGTEKLQMFKLLNRLPVACQLFQEQMFSFKTRKWDRKECA